MKYSNWSITTTWKIAYTFLTTRMRLSTELHRLRGVKYRNSKKYTVEMEEVESMNKANEIKLLLQVVYYFF